MSIVQIGLKYLPRSKDTYGGTGLGAKQLGFGGFDHTLCLPTHI